MRSMAGKARITADSGPVWQGAVLHVPLSGEGRLDQTPPCMHARLQQQQLARHCTAPALSWVSNALRHSTNQTEKVVVNYTRVL